MNGTSALSAAGLAIVLTGLCVAASAEDWAISATENCRTSLGNTVSSGGGLQASGGTAVVTCALTREGGSDTLNQVYARLKRNSASGADPFCYVSTRSNHGTPSSAGYGYASDTTANQSVSISLPTQYSYGYADIGCVLNSGDTLYGIRYLQDN